jgi:oligoribonuclease
MTTKDTNLIWIDLEMTGLNPMTDVIIEIATVVTDKDLNIVAEGPVIAVHQSDDTLSKMDEWNTNQHGKSGLIDRVRNSTYSSAQAEAETLAFLAQYVPENCSPMCGNTICQDRRFLAMHMQNLEKFFHYRQLDVSTLKILAKMWGSADALSFKKESSHLALNDIYDSIAELAHYRSTFLKVSVE